MIKSASENDHQIVNIVTLTYTSDKPFFQHHFSCDSDSGNYILITKNTKSEQMLKHVLDTYKGCEVLCCKLPTFLCLGFPFSVLEIPSRGEIQRTSRAVLDHTLEFLFTLSSMNCHSCGEKRFAGLYMFRFDLVS